MGLMWIGVTCNISVCGWGRYEWLNLMVDVGEEIESNQISDSTSMMVEDGHERWSMNISDMCIVKMESFSPKMGLALGRKDMGNEYVWCE